jgi:hypothetical protein
MRRLGDAIEGDGTLNRRNFLKLLGGLAGGALAGAALPRVSLQPEVSSFLVPAAAGAVSAGTQHFYINPTAR